MKKDKVTINGRFFGVTGTGVQRVAEELIIAMDQILTNESSMAEKIELDIIVPKNVTVQLSLKSIKIIQAGLLSGFFSNILWEQLNLPFLAKGKTLLSLCNTSSIFIKNAVVMIHDAQVYISPKSYSPGFREWYKFILPKIGRNSKKIITVSEYSKSQLASYNIASDEKIEVIHNGVDHVLNNEPDDTIFSKTNVIKSSYCIAQSNTQAHKNIEVLIKAFALPTLKDYKLVLYGSAKKEDFEALGLFVPENIIFTGRVTDAELRALIQNAVATLTPSLTEGFGLQPLEGMILSCPAIVAPKGALAEVCGDVGLYANPYQPEAWAKAINYLIENDEFRLAMKEKVKIHAQNFTWKNAALKLLNLVSQS